MKINNFYLSFFSFDIVVVILFTNLISLIYSFWNYITELSILWTNLLSLYQKIKDLYKSCRSCEVTQLCRQKLLHLNLFSGSKLDLKLYLSCAKYLTLGKHFLFFICLYLNDLFHVLNKFKLKNCQLQSFITFQDIQLSFWYFLYPMSFMKFEFQISEVQMYFSLRRWFQIKKISTTRLFNFWRSTTFILVFFIRYSGSNIVHKSYKSHI